MAQRLVKIILPESQGEGALGLLAELELVDFSKEETLGDHCAVNVLIDSGQSEALMDRFQ